MDSRIEKIKKSSENRVGLMQEVLNNWNDEEYILDKLGICKKTIKKWKGRLEVLEKLRKITIDRALKEVLFTKKIQVECFEWLMKDLNYFSTYNEVTKVMPITRYHFTIVKNYIKDELNRP